MIENEKKLEDYICDHQEQFIETLKTSINDEDCDIKFLGRQVRIGKDNIADLVYYYDYNFLPPNGIEIRERTYIIVELKFRPLESKDLSQLARYMNILEEKISREKKYQDYETTIKGVFVSFGESEEMQDISMRNFKNISYISFKCDLTFFNDDWVYTDEYLKKIKLDNRLEQLYKEE